MWQVDSQVDPDSQTNPSHVNEMRKTCQERTRSAQDVCSGPHDTLSDVASQGAATSWKIQSLKPRWWNACQKRDVAFRVHPTARSVCIYSTSFPHLQHVPTHTTTHITGTRCSTFSQPPNSAATPHIPQHPERKPWMLEADASS